MAHASFLRESDKAGLSPFFPLTCFPDRAHAEYHVFELQQRSSCNIIHKMNFHEIETKLKIEKGKSKLKPIESRNELDYLMSDD